MFKVLAAIHITTLTMLAVNMVGTTSCNTGQPITMSLPIVVFGMLAVTFVLGYLAAKEK